MIAIATPKSAPDAGLGTQAITAALYKKLPYDHRRDFTLISLYGTMPNILSVTPSLSVASVPEFINLQPSGSIAQHQDQRHRLSYRLAVA